MTSHRSKMQPQTSTPPMTSRGENKREEIRSHPPEFSKIVPAEEKKKKTDE